MPPFVSIPPLHALPDHQTDPAQSVSFTAVISSIDPLAGKSERNEVNGFFKTLRPGSIVRIEQLKTEQHITTGHYHCAPNVTTKCKLPGYVYGYISQLN
ncbi:hypothetical protein J6590_030683 [Homalodisca vitripennis]|nr:hypothetical protein J6590_030683 [Homalodisca vitripennis]